jgi:hypothetical protein
MIGMVLVAVVQIQRQRVELLAHSGLASLAGLKQAQTYRLSVSE